MTLHLRPTPGQPAEILPFPNTQAEDMDAVEGQLRNLLAVLAHGRGPVAARLILAETAVRVIADNARETGHAIATRFALDMEIRHQFDPAPGPGGSGAGIK